MAEGQGNGNDSPERDSAWQPAPGDGTPAADTEPGTGAAPAPGGSWVPMPMTSPTGDAGAQPPSQPGPGPQQVPGAPPAVGRPGFAPQPGSGEPGAPPHPAQQSRPLGGPGTPWQGQPTRDAAAQPWLPPGAPSGQPAPGAQPPAAQVPYGTAPPHAAAHGGQPAYGAPQGSGQPPYGAQPPYGQPSYGEAAWQPPGTTNPVPPLPGEILGAVPPGSGGHWAAQGDYGGLPAAGPPPSRGWVGRALVYIVVAVLAAAAGAGAVFALRGSAGQAPASSVSSQVIPKPKANRAGGRNIGGINVSAVARKVEQGLVDITSFVHLQQQVFEGTGMVLTPGGLVLTNNHVIKGSTRVRVTVVTTGKQYAAQVVGTDNSQDVALLRLVGASGLKTIQPGDSNKVKIGTPVIALGNAGGTGGLPTVSQPGTITALNRTIQASDAGSRTTETLHHMFQSSAPIAEGDSGGALANSAGQVIAMNTAANSQNIGGAGTSQGYSIPIDRALAIVRLMAAGHASSTIQLGQPAFLGIAIATTGSGTTSNATSPQVQLRQFQAIAAQSGFGAVNSSGHCLPTANVNPVPGSIAPATSGALIGAVFCNEPATGAGAQAGDVITAVNGHAVTSASSLHAVIHSYRPGQAVTLTVVTPNGQQQHISFRLAAGPAA